MRTPFELGAALCLLVTSFVLACSGDDTSPSSPAPSAITVTVDYKGTESTVDIAGLAKQDYKGSQVVSLGKVWEASKAGADLSAVEFDFEGDDGFRPSSKDRCKTKVTGAQLPQGYVLPETRTLIWDDTLGLPGCYSVKGVKKILATDK